MKFAFAGDRSISVDILEFIILDGYEPEVLLLPSEDEASHSEELLDLVDLSEEKILRGKEFKSEEGKEILSKLDLDYIISIHFPHIYPGEVLDIPSECALNLHPAYLPYCKGWHTPSWAIYEDVPFGGTLHFMSEEIDEGDIVHQKKVDVSPADTADDLYEKGVNAEKKVFKEAWPDLKNFTYSRKEQSEEGNHHKSGDLEKIKELDLDEKKTVESVVRKLRALTTNKMSESAYFEKNNEKYRVQVKIEKDED